MGSVGADAEWEASYMEAISEIHGDVSFEESAQMLRKLIMTGLLRFTDLQNNPERFFSAHRLLLAPTRNDDEGSGFGVRFTVQYNLFCGSVLVRCHIHTYSLLALHVYMYMYMYTGGFD